MPISRLRRRSSATPAPAKAPVRVGSPRWLAPLMLACFVLGLLWIVVFYVTSAQFPVPGIGNWNLAAGFGLISVGFLLSTQWK